MTTAPHSGSTDADEALETGMTIVDNKTGISRMLIVRENNGGPPVVVAVTFRPREGVPVDVANAALMRAFFGAANGTAEALGTALGLALPALHVPAPPMPPDDEPAGPATPTTPFTGITVARKVTPGGGRRKVKRDGSEVYGPGGIDRLKELYDAHGGSPTRIAHATGHNPKTVSGWLGKARRDFPARFRRVT